MSDDFYARVGGETFFTQLVKDFYAGIPSDPILRPMYPEGDLEPAIRRLTLFLMQFWGGPDTYSQERGHPRLRMRHAAFAIDEKARDAWLKHMMAAVEKQSMEKTLRDELVTYLIQVAHFLVNETPKEVNDLSRERKLN
ncbi:MAG: globin [Actinobacteria bacterium]|nr:globin [Actinomycetota bacterium]